MQGLADGLIFEFSVKRIISVNDSLGFVISLVNKNIVLTKCIA